MTFRGVVRNGKIELDGPAELPEGTAVNVSRVPVSPRRKRSKKYDSMTDPAFRISELAMPFGRVDGSIEHDHYIYGTPKRYDRKKKAAVKPRKARRKR
jgi:hypothetical protein